MDALELKLARLGPELDVLESKAGAVPGKPGKPGKGGKARPKPPWLDDDSDDDESDDADTADQDADDGDDEERKPSRPPKAPRGQKAVPARGMTPRQPDRGRNGEKPAVRARRNRTGAEVQPVASSRAGWADEPRVRGSRGTGRSAAPRGSSSKTARGADRITSWGPPNQRVDVRRGRGDGAGDMRPSDARARRAAREAEGESFRVRRGNAGGNGVTRGNSGSAIQQNRPRNVRGAAPRDGWRPSADVGEGRTWGRSGSAIVPHRPNNLKKDLWSYSPDEVANALHIATKALNGLIGDLDADFRGADEG